MQFTTRRRKQAPTVIIISLIDVLLVVLIFLMVTTQFKQQPAVKLALPTSNEPKAGANENMLIVTLPKDGPIYLKTEPVTLESLKQKLAQAVHENPQTTLAIRADTEAGVGQVLKIKDAAYAAHIQVVNIFIKAAQ
jgi:biopolymer transport protein ExbD